MILPLIVGYGMRRSSIFHPNLFNRLMDIGIVGFEPILACLSFWVIPLEIQLVWLPILGIIMVIIPGVFAFIRANRKYNQPLDKGGFILGAMLPNRGVIGMLTVFAIYGETGYALVQIIMLTSPLILQLFCFPLAEYYYQSQYKQETIRTPILSLFLNRRQMPLLGILLGLVLNLSGVYRPVVFGEIFPYLVHISAWLFVVPVGYSLVFQELQDHWKNSLDVLWIKFLATPVLMYLILLPINLSDVVTDVLLILSFAPTAINAVVTARLFRLNVHVPMTAFMLTTIFYLLVMLPLILWWFG
jgi:predicted permease